MPGSRKAVGECYEAIAAIIPHALHHMRGDTVSISKVHRSLTTTTEAVQTPPVTNTTVRPKHICPHKTANLLDTNDRNSPYPMVSVKDALQAILNSLPKRVMGPVEVSAVDLPPFRASIKDGYAVRSSEGKGIRIVSGNISAGDGVKSFKYINCIIKLTFIFLFINAHAD